MAHLSKVDQSPYKCCCFHGAYMESKCPVCHLSCRKHMIYEIAAPRPWEIEESFQEEVYINSPKEKEGLNNVACLSQEGNKIKALANAEYILRAVNNFDEMLICLKKSAEEMERAYKAGSTMWCPDWLWHKRIRKLIDILDGRAAIAKAEKGE